MLLLHPIKNDDYCIKTQEPKKGIYICTSFKGPKSLMQNLLIIQFCYGAKSKLMPRTISMRRRVDASTLAQYIFHVYLAVNPRSELDFKIVTVGLNCRTLVLSTLHWKPRFYMFII